MVYPVPDDKSNSGSRHYRTRKQELRENEQDAHTQQSHCTIGVMTGKLAADCGPRTGFTLRTSMETLGRAVFFPHASHFNNNLIQYCGLEIVQPMQGKKARTDAKAVLGKCCFYIRRQIM